jgi:tetratricopeptide (TPR) repeat protein
MNKEVLEKRRRILGEEHLDTITIISNLVNTLRDLG